MALQQSVYVLTIHGAGPGHHAAYTALERTKHLDLGRSSYLVLGDEARVSITAHNGQGNVEVTAALAGAGTLHDEEAIDADTADIDRFVELIAGVPLQWNEETGSWSLPGFAPAAGQTAVVTHREAALAALRAALATQRR